MLRTALLLSSLSFALLTSVALAAPQVPEPEPGPGVEEADVHIVRLKHRRVEALQNTLRNFLQEDIQARQHAQGGGRGGAQLRRPVVVAHSESNSLLVSASQADHKMIERLVAALDAPGADAVDPARPADGVSVRVDGDAVVLTPKGAMGIPLRELIDITNGLTGKALLHHEQDAEHVRIHLAGSLRVPRAEFFALFQTLLAAEGFACVVHDTNPAAVVEVIRTNSGDLPGTRGRWVAIEALEQDPFVAGSHVRTTVTLANTPVAQALQGLPKTQRSTADGVHAFAIDPQTVVLQGFAPRVVEFTRAIRRLDVRDNETAVLTLEHFAATSVVTTLMQLLQPQPGSAPNCRVVALDDRTIVLRGSRQAVAEARDLIALLDAPTK